ncbi:MAG: hypothetical protein V6Z86_05490 [Hyphomicrobiales bacterium]
MPCSSGPGPGQTDIQREDEIRRQHMNVIHILEARLCALLNEIERRRLPSIIDEAENQGQIDIRGWWENHSKNDEQRVRAMMTSHFSKDEIEILRKILT